jgi:tetratricopeptide (TPR) repeat protein
MIPRPLDVPNVEHVVNIDASPGIYAPAQITIDEIYRGDTAVALNTIYSSASAAQRDQAMHDKANGYFDGFEVSSSSIAFDKSKRELNLTLKGTAKLSWKDGWFYVPTSSIAFDPDFHRQAGPFHDVPLAVGFPSYVKDKATISLPHGFAVAQDLSAPVHETLAGVEYARSETVDGDLVTVDSSERSIAPEVPFKDALTAESRLRALNKDDVYLGVPTGYAPTPKDLAALKETSPGSADDYFVRATAELAAKEVDGATADLTAGLALDPKNASALRKRAGIYFDKHDFAAGEKDLAAAEVIDPDDPLNIKLHGYLAELKDDYEAAVNWYSKALAKNPKDAFSLVHRSRAYDGLGKYDASLSDLNAAVALDPRDGSAYGRRAVVYAMRGDFVAAHKDLDTAIKLSPAAFEVLNARAAIAADEGNDEAAAEAYTAVVNASPKDGWALASRAQAYLSIGEKDKALADTDQALAVGYRTPDVRVIRANIFFQRGDRNAAAKEADAILAENPDSDLAQVSAGKIYAAVGRNDDATKALTRALQLKPAAYIYLNLADVRPVTDYAQRMSDVENALKLEPDSVLALDAKAYLLRIKGDYVSSVQLYDQALKIEPNNSDLALQKAIALYKSGQRSDAEKIFAAQRSKTKTGGSLESVCWSETIALFLDQAVEDCREAQRLAPKDDTNHLGFALLQAGKLDDALTAFEAAIARNPGTAFPYMGRAFVYARKGDSARAKADKARALALDPRIEDQFAEYGLKWDVPGAASKKTEAAARN